MGNHEFDWGKEFIPQWSKAGLPFLSSNVKLKDGGLPPGIEEGRIFTVGGMRVGVVGLTTTSTSRITPTEHTGHLNFLPPVQSLEGAVQKLRKEGAEAIIVLAHLAGKEKKEWKDGVAPAIRPLAAVPGVSAVVYGHSHQ